MIRIGQSSDIHQLVEGRDLILGGVKVPYEKGLLLSLSNGKRWGQKATPCREESSPA